MTQRTLHIYGQVSDRQTRQGLATVQVEACSSKAGPDRHIQNVTTNERGSFELVFPKADVSGAFLGERSALYFKLLREGQLIARVAGLGECEVTVGSGESAHR